MSTPASLKNASIAAFACASLRKAFGALGLYAFLRKNSPGRF